MPSFFPANAPGPIPLPTPEYGARYSRVSNGGAHEHSNSFAAHPNVRAYDVGPLHFDPYDAYKKTGAPPPSMYNPMGGQVNPQMSIPHLINAPFMAPLQIEERWAADLADDPMGCQRGPIEYVERQTKEEKTIGGVSARLDYEMEQMTDFVFEMAIGMYEVLIPRICITDIDLLRSIKPGISFPPAFRKWVLQVLSATRLPSATILLSLSYLALRIHGLSARGRLEPLEKDLYKTLTVGLILGSKFLDDNTFQNKSWAEVSHINVVELNQAERDWLDAFKFKLHYDPEAVDGFKTWQEKWRAYKTRPALPITALLPLDTNIRRQRSIQHSISRNPYQSQHSNQPLSSISRDGSFVDSQYSRTPTYSPYDPWFNHHSAVDKSPSTAPHTGPTTPDYYGGHGMWGPVDNYSRRSTYGYPSAPQFTPYMAPYPLSYNTMQFPHMSQNIWNCHGAACQCGGCRQAHLMPHRYGSVVG